jgi:hypothetical protein
VKSILKSSITLLFLLAFLLPQVVKSLHFHDHEIACTSETGRHFDYQTEKCEICDYSISVFTSTIENGSFSKISVFDNYLNLYSSVLISKPTSFSFQLRAPPADNDF